MLPLLAVDVDIGMPTVIETRFRVSRRVEAVTRGLFQLYEEQIKTLLSNVEEREFVHS